MHQRRSIKSFAPDETEVIDVLITNVIQSKTKKGEEFQKYEVRDLEMNDEIVMNFKQILDFTEIPCVCQMKIHAQQANDKVYYHCVDVDKSEVPLKDFIPKGASNTDEYYKNIISGIKRIKNQFLGGIVCQVIKNNYDNYFKAPLTTNNAFSRPSGLIEATSKLIDKINAYLNNCPYPYNKSLLYAGASIYFIGSIYCVDEFMKEQPSNIMLGSSISCLNELVKASNKKELTEVEEEALMFLENIILTDGYKVYPRSPEACLLQSLAALVKNEDLFRLVTNRNQNGDVIRNTGFNNKTTIMIPKYDIEPEEEDG